MLRVLFVLSDTDRSDRNLIALELHRGLARLDLEMRTAALAPGRQGGLDDMVPALCPARRSLSAVTQLRREQRWADVVVCWDARAALVQRLSGSRRSLPTVVVTDGDRSPSTRRASLAARGAIEHPPDDHPTQWFELLDSVAITGTKDA